MKELKDMLCKELDALTQQRNLTPHNLDMIDKLTHSIKSIATIEAMKEGEYSNRGSYESSYFGGGNELYPFMNQAEVTTNGFQNLSTQNQISSVQSDLGDIQTQLCNGFAGVNATINNGFAQSEIADNARAMNNMQQMFSLQSQFADCCCENRLANCQTQNVIQTEGSATRFADLNNTRDIMENCNRNNQAILDKLCSLELDAKQDKINDLERQLTMANLSASQIQQTATIQQGQVAEVDALYQRLKDCPVGTMPVYGSQPIFTCGCNNNGGCGCGM